MPNRKPDPTPYRPIRRSAGGRPSGWWAGFAFAVLASVAWLLSKPAAGVRTGAVDPLTAEPGQLWAPILVMLGLMALNAALVAAETAMELLRPAHVKHLRETNDRKAERLQGLLDGRARHIAACSLGSHVLRLAVGLVVWLSVTPQVMAFAVDRFGIDSTRANEALTVVLLMVPVGFVHVILSELLPRSYAVLHPHRMAAGLYVPITMVSALLSVIAMTLTGIAGLITSRFGGKASFTVPNAAEEEILNLVESAEEQGEIESEERELLRSVFDFTDTVAREVMTPRVDLDALPARSDPMDAVRLIQDSGHSRIPLYEDTDDQIVGIIHAKDLLLAMLNGKAPNLRSLMRPAMFVPENKNLYELITEMRQQRSQMAIVQDEFGGTAGIVTVEDIVEELVGEIVDEYDVDEPDIVEAEDGWLVKGKTHVDDVGEATGKEFPSEEFDTIGGYVFGLFGRQPKLGQEIEADGVRFTVAETDGRRISKLLVQLVSAAEESEATGASAE